MISSRTNHCEESATPRSIRGELHLRASAPPATPAQLISKLDGFERRARQGAPCGAQPIIHAKTS
jgi:hypothetical protein